MDAVEFFKTVKRLCKNPGCEGCPVCKDGMCMVMRMARLDDTSYESIEETISKVEQWMKDHPVMSRQSAFLKMFPNAPKSGRVLDICPRTLNTEYMPPKRCENTSCGVCKIDYWSEEVTDND